MGIVDSFSTQPGENGNRPAPGGAPEGMGFGAVNDCLRQVMAACAELRERISEAGGNVGSLGTQAKEAVEILGGTIAGALLGSTNTIDGAAIKTGTVARARLPADIQNPPTGVSPQGAYDLVYPIGGGYRAWHSTINFVGLIPAGVAATWTVVTAAQDALLAIAGTSYTAAAAVGAGTAVTLAGAGGHTPSGTAGGHRLTNDELPTHLASIGNPPLNPAGTQVSDINLDSGGNNDLAYRDGQASPHTHPLSMDAVADHNHVATLPKRFAVVLLQRTA